MSGNREIDPAPGIPARIREARLEAELNQSEVAKALGISRSTFTKMELGQCAVYADQIPRLAHFLKQPITYFFEATT